MTRHVRRARLTAACALFLAATSVHAQNQPEAVQQLPRVESDVKRDDSSSAPYAQLNELLWRLKTQGEGLFRLRFQLQPRDKAQPLRSDVKLALLSPERYVPIALDAERRFELPSFPPEEAKEMELGSNLPKKSAAFRGEIEITTPPEQLDMATVRRIVRVGQKLRGELLPWYLRWLMPQVEGVRVCSETPRMTLEWPEQGQTLELVLPLDKSLREPGAPKDGTPRHCTLLTGQEPWPDAARLQPGVKTRLTGKLSGVS
ncbi:hypothetical protein LZ017_01425 [Pelomonas sp. CA6]|uniref:hypothetical protein n=1 Tax=Pelomonas sp. CA6 TaxID=2907999 RepID=UPI001F4B0CFC|nr:hypothetical protein [Pelomonas sp. CA6]MCH7342046.1 hypothetical protein [Pelomonas sp. CA6]